MVSKVRLPVIPEMRSKLAGVNAITFDTPAPPALDEYRKAAVMHVASAVLSLGNKHLVLYPLISENPLWESPFSTGRVEFKSGASVSVHSLVELVKGIVVKPSASEDSSELEIELPASKAQPAKAQPAKAQPAKAQPAKAQPAKTSEA